MAGDEEADVLVLTDSSAAETVRTSSVLSYWASSKAQSAGRVPGMEWGRGNLLRNQYGHRQPIEEEGQGCERVLRLRMSEDRGRDPLGTSLYAPSFLRYMS